VVTSAQFLIDSESKLREATAKMLQATKAEKSPAQRPNVLDETGHQVEQAHD
jgi:Cu(I)/Ag(I) efflux system membrane fusion protein